MLNTRTAIAPDDNVTGEGFGVHVVFGKTDGIGWYRVSKDGGQTFDIVFGNSTYEVELGTQLIVQVGDLTGDSFRFYVNGNGVEPDENGNLVVTVDGYMLIGLSVMILPCPMLMSLSVLLKKLLRQLRISLI